MKTITKLVSIVGMGLLFTSCEKEVNFNLPASISEKVVVEGSIEVGLPPAIMFTKSLGFFSKLDLSSWQGSFLHGAVMTVSDGSRSVVLREYTLDTLDNSYSFYTIDSANLNDLTFLGVEGKTYSLKIEYDGKVYESTTSIPQAVPLDSIWSAPLDNPVDDHPEYRKIIARYTDPPTKGNRFRYYVQQNSRPYFASRYSTANDDIINGTSIELEFYNVISPMDTASGIEAYAFNVGDTVSIKLSSIDYDTYNFWNTLDFSVGTTGNPFSTPIKVMTNIKGGALGVWAGYAPAYKTIIIEE